MVAEHSTTLSPGTPDVFRCDADRPVPEPQTSGIGRNIKRKPGHEPAYSSGSRP